MTPLAAIRELKADIAALRAENARLRELNAELRKAREVGNERMHIICVCPDCLRKKQ
jgi:hypothetical protein